MSKLPTNWQSVSLGQICNVEMGQSPESSTYNDEGKGLPFFQGKAEFGRFHPSVRKWCTDPKKVAEQGDILLSIRAPVGPSNIASEKCIIGRGLAALRAIEPVYQEYVFHLIRKLEPWLGQQGTGTTFKAISGEFVRSIEVPLAPNNEQKRIADKLDAVLARVDACRDRLDRIPAILKRIRQSVLAAATSGKLTEEWKINNGYESKWDHGVWSDILKPGKDSFKRGPFGSSLKKDIFVKMGYKVYEQYCPINDDCSYSRYYITPQKFEEMRVFEVQESDFLISCSGVSLGRITQVPKKSEMGIINQALLRVRIDSTKYNDDFFKLLFRSPAFQKSIFENSTGSAIPNLKGVKDLKAMAVPLPVLKEQTEIVRRVESLFAYADRLEARYHAARAQVEKLTPALLAKAFRGELVPQDPNDEPSSELLVRIAAAQSTDKVKKARKPASGKNDHVSS